jgi:hypothetical protein
MRVGGRSARRVSQRFTGGIARRDSGRCARRIGGRIAGGIASRVGGRMSDLWGDGGMDCAFYVCLEG